MTTIESVLTDINRREQAEKLANALQLAKQRGQTPSEPAQFSVAATAAELILTPPNHNNPAEE